MQILIKQAKIINQTSPYHLQTCDVLIEQGRITEIGTISNKPDAHIIAHEGLCLSLGWVDLKSDFCDPGHEHKETIGSGLRAAEFGGYTHVAVLPSTNPVVDGKSQIEYMMRRAEHAVCQIHPMGSITHGMKGENLSEMFDMFQSGVRLFTDDLVPVNSGIMYRALLYAKNFGGRVVGFSRNQFLSGKGVVNEGMASTLTGLKADPGISEVIEVERNLRLLEYTGGALHLTGISTAESVRLIRQAKKNLLNITADVHINNLVYNENAVTGFDTNFKVLPPLRFEEDRKALWAGVIDGTIDAIVTDHRPMDKEEKDLEFDLAEFGSIQLQTALGALQQCEEFELTPVISALSEHPRTILGLETTKIEKGEHADLTLFAPEKRWKFDAKHLISKTNNTPYVEKDLKGTIVCVINQSKLATFEY